MVNKSHDENIILIKAELKTINTEILVGVFIDIKLSFYIHIKFMCRKSKPKN